MSVIGRRFARRCWTRIPTSRPNNWKLPGSSISSVITSRALAAYAPEDAYARGMADLDAVAGLLGDRSFMFGPRPGSVDAGMYGFVANIHYYDIDTPLKRHLQARTNLVEHCQALRAEIS